MGNDSNRLSVSQRVKLPLFGDIDLNFHDNLEIFKNVQQFSKSSERFR